MKEKWIGLTTLPEKENKVERISYSNRLKKTYDIEQNLVKAEWWLYFSAAYKKYFNEKITKADVQMYSFDQYVKKIIGGTSDQKIDLYIRLKNGHHFICEFADSSGIWNHGHQSQAEHKGNSFRRMPNSIVFSFAAKYHDDIIEDIIHWNTEKKDTNGDLKIIPFNAHYTYEERLGELRLYVDINHNFSERKPGIVRKSKLSDDPINFDIIKAAIGSEFSYKENKDYLTIDLNGLKVNLTPYAKNPNKVAMWSSESTFKNNPSLNKTYDQIESTYKCTRRTWGVAFNDRIQTCDERIIGALHKLEKSAK